MANSLCQQEWCSVGGRPFILTQSWACEMASSPSCGNVFIIHFSEIPTELSRQDLCFGLWASGDPTLWRDFLEMSKVFFWCLRRAWSGSAIQGSLSPCFSPLGCSLILCHLGGEPDSFGMRSSGNHRAYGLSWFTCVGPVSRSFPLLVLYLFLRMTCRAVRRVFDMLILCGSSHLHRLASKNKTNLCWSLISLGGLSCTTFPWWGFSTEIAFLPLSAEACMAHTSP